jgi:hypothetical protein
VNKAKFENHPNRAPILDRSDGFRRKSQLPKDLRRFEWTLFQVAKVRNVSKVGAIGLCTDGSGSTPIADAKLTSLCLLTSLNRALIPVPQSMGSFEFVTFAG